MTHNNLKIAIIPHDIVWGDKEENLLSIAELLHKVERDTDLVILPELFTTGVISDSSMINDLAEPNSGKTIETVHRWASYFKFAICGSFIATTASNYYNRAFFIEPSGDENFYDKKHLFSIGGESQIFSQGTCNAPIIRYRGWNIKMIVCYDLRFPVWCRNRLNNYDLLIVPANWPLSRAYPWNQLLIARAIENQCYVIGANRSGKDDFGIYDIADSKVINCKGEPIQSSIEQGIIYAELSKEKLETFRAKFPVWNDADIFSIE